MQAQSSVVVQMAPGGVAGQSLVVQGPNGPFTVVLPAGVELGQQFGVMVPVPPAEGGGGQRSIKLWQQISI